MRVNAAKFAGIAKLTPDQMNLLKVKPSDFSPKSGACIGCGGELALRLVSKAIAFESNRVRWRDKNGEIKTGGAGVMQSPHTGCMQVVMSTQDTNAWMDTSGAGLIRSSLHNSFSDGTSNLNSLHNTYLSRIMADDPRIKIEKPFYFWTFGGDGATTIGMGQISSFFQQGYGLLVVYDNRGYMNTGAQVSSTTWPFENRATTPTGKVLAGNQFLPRDLIKIAAAHNVPFAATASIAHPRDLMEKVRYAINVPGPTFIWVDAPCPKEQGFAGNQTVETSKLAVETGLFPLVRYQYGQWAVDYLRSLERTKREVPLEQFLAAQKESKHIAKEDFKENLKILKVCVEERYDWFLTQAKADAGDPPSLYLKDGEEEPVRGLDEF